MYALGFDIGSSSIKTALVELKNGTVVSTAQYPEVEMSIDSPQPGWAEQDPELWWKYAVKATHLLLKDISPEITQKISGIGISYQMHGLVLTNKDGGVLRPSIIWCDSRAISSGNLVAQEVGSNVFMQKTLNHPGNFTASKFKWVHDHEPEIYAQTDKIMLPGDFIGYKLTGCINTTRSGLSEGILWDFEKASPAHFSFDAFHIKPEMIPSLVDTFSTQGTLTPKAADELGIQAGVPLCYRAGDQPNNAMSLGALKPGDIAATGGTSGVVYGVMDKHVVDPKSRINSFAHVNYNVQNKMTGALLCINGAGSMYRWIKQMAAEDGLSYSDMEVQASKIAIGANELTILPFGNGAERMLENKDVGAQILHIDFNRHTKAHLYRAALEGIAFSFVYGTKVLEASGVNPNVIKAGNDNLFQSHIFSSTIATLLNCNIELVETTGAIGAAKASAFTLGIKPSIEEAMQGNTTEKIIYPETHKKPAMQAAYQNWLKELQKALKNT